jgi:transcription elongation factor Elf1
MINVCGPLSAVGSGVRTQTIMEKERKNRKLRCKFCGKRFKKGGTRYRIRIEVLSDFNGYLEDWSRKPEDFLQKKIQKALEDTKNMTEKEIEEQIYLKREFLACVKCREKFLKDLRTFRSE